jgi:hypothetical protein
MSFLSVLLPSRLRLAGCLCGLGALTWASAAPAFELYSWTVAEAFCELRSYGMERKQAISKAAELTFARNPFMRVEFTQDAAVIIKDKETLAVARIRREAERQCPKLAKRSKEEDPAAQDASKVPPNRGRVDPRPGATP